MTPDLVVFDCDGVLVDTEGPMLEVFLASFARYGLHMTPEDAAAQFTGSTPDILRDKAIAMGADLPPYWIAEVFKDIYTRIEAGVETFDGVVLLIDDLLAANVPVFVASNGEMARMKLSLGPSGIWDKLAGRILSCETLPAKPDPAMIAYAIAQTGADPARSFMIDDSVPGCQAGLNAGVNAIGFATHGQDATLAKLGVHVANSMADVRRLILG